MKNKYKDEVTYQTLAGEAPVATMPSKEKLADILIKMKEEVSAGKKDPIILLHSMLVKFELYFLGEAFNSKLPIDEKLADAYQSLRHDLEQEAFGNKLTHKLNDLLIGEFIEELFFFGLPRKAAIEAAAKWLGVGEKTVRDANVLFRRTYPDNIRPSPGSRQSDNLLLFLGEQVDIYAMFEMLQKPNFPYDHPKARKAFEDLKDHVGNPNNEGYWL